MASSPQSPFDPIRSDETGHLPPAGPAQGSGSAARPQQARGSRVRRALLAVLAVILVGSGVGAGLWALFPLVDPEEAVTYDMAGNPVQADPDAVNTQPEASATADIGLRFVVPSVQLDVPLGTADAVDGVIAPPGFQSAYLVGNYGVGLDKADQGTVYVAAHSLRNGGVAPGNYLIDVESGKAKVNPGDLIKVSDRTYTVTETRIIPKPNVGEVLDLWADVPKRLVVFTCMLNADNSPSRDNLVVIATLS